MKRRRKKGVAFTTDKNETFHFEFTARYRIRSAFYEGNFTSLGGVALRYWPVYRASRRRYEIESSPSPFGKFLRADHRKEVLDAPRTFVREIFDFGLTIVAIYSFWYVTIVDVQEVIIHLFACFIQTWRENETAVDYFLYRRGTHETKTAAVV